MGNSSKKYLKPESAPSWINVLALKVLAPLTVLMVITLGTAFMGRYVASAAYTRDASISNSRILKLEEKYKSIEKSLMEIKADQKKIMERLWNQRK